jgi:two-component system KDP operon response regulator KdpE
MKRALIIDDDEMDLELLKVLLSKEGYNIISTADGPQGILLYKHHHPDLVCLDLGLPSMSGMDVLETIREFDPCSKILLITGYGSEASSAAALKLGAIGYVEKSWDVQLMICRINDELSKIDHQTR